MHIFAHLAPGLVKPMRNQWFLGVPARKNWILAKKSTFPPRNRIFAEFPRFCWKWARISLFSEKAPQEPYKYHTNYCRFRTGARQAGIFTENALLGEEISILGEFLWFSWKCRILVIFCTFSTISRPLARKAAIVMQFHRYFRGFLGQKRDLSSEITFFTEKLDFRWRSISSWKR